MPDGKVFSGAHAGFKALALSGQYVFLLRMYEKLPLFGPVSELFYQLVAHHRIFFSRFTVRASSEYGARLPDGSTGLFGGDVDIVSMARARAAETV